jgi:flavodoxin
MREKATELEPLQHQPGDYDLLVVGTPVWAAHPAPAVRTFLTSHHLSGKKVALFSTMNARGGEQTCAIMKELLSGAELLGTLAVAMKGRTDDQIEKRVNEWTSGWKKSG